MCHKQRHHTAQQLGVRTGTLTLAEANRHGQQLFFAGMHRLAGGHWEYQKKTVPAHMRLDLSLLRPVTHQQLLAFDLPHDLRAGLWDKFLPPPDPLLEAAFHEFVREHARLHGWAIGKTATVQRAIRILLGIQDTPGAAIHRSDVALLTRIKHSAAVVADVLAAAGMLHEDREPAVVGWFTTVTADLPAPMRAELAAWFDVMRHGNPTPPRSKPRSDKTLRSQLAFALPALTRWAGRHDSLKEIARADVLAALPPSGAARNAMAQALRSIFRALKARKLVFANPMSRIHVPAPTHPIPTVPDLVRLRGALDAPDPDAALIAALLAYHAVRVHQLRDLRLTDFHDGRLHLTGRDTGQHADQRTGHGEQQTILLADPVRDRLRTYLDHRAATWPATINPHLFVNVRNAAHTRPVNVNWASDQLGMSCQQIRLDRIFYEAVSTGGDLRALADLFGLSIATAARYAALASPGRPAPAG